jgi:hypothetical protein
MSVTRGGKLEQETKMPKLKKKSGRKLNWLERKPMIVIGNSNQE